MARRKERRKDFFLAVCCSVNSDLSKYITEKLIYSFTLSTVNQKVSTWDEVRWSYTPHWSRFKWSFRYLRADGNHRSKGMTAWTVVKWICLISKYSKHKTVLCYVYWIMPKYYSHNYIYCILLLLFGLPSWLLQTFYSCRTFKGLLELGSFHFD